MGSTISGSTWLARSRLTWAASTGGFTDVLLSRGAAKVYAVDVGTNQLAWKLRQDPRVVVLEQTNARYLTAAQVPEPVDVIVCDASFIGLAKVLEAPLNSPNPEPNWSRLIKPQFEAGREEVGKGGVVRDEVVRRRVCDAAAEWVASQGWEAIGVIESPITGPQGNVEYLARRNKDLGGEIGDSSAARGGGLAGKSLFGPRKGRHHMQSENKMFDDMVKMVNGLAGTVAGMGREAEASGARENARVDGGRPISSAATNSKRSRRWRRRRATRMRR